MGVSWNGGTPKSSILIGFSIINHPFWGTTILGNPHMTLLARRLVAKSAKQLHLRANSPKNTSCSLTPSKSFSVRVPVWENVERWEVAVVNHTLSHSWKLPSITRLYKVAMFTLSFRCCLRIKKKIEDFGKTSSQAIAWRPLITTQLGSTFFEIRRKCSWSTYPALTYPPRNKALWSY